MCKAPDLSIREAADSLKQFVTDNIPDGTPVDITDQKAEELNQLIENTLALAQGTSPVDMDISRQAYEAVGWLSVQIESWFIDSSFEDALLETWARGKLR